MRIAYFVVLTIVYFVFESITKGMGIVGLGLMMLTASLCFHISLNKTLIDLRIKQFFFWGGLIILIGIFVRLDSNVVEYKNEGRRLFDVLLQNIDNAIVDMLLKAEIRQRPEKAPTAVGVPTEVGRGIKGKSKRKIGRNDPCPCGKINPETGKPIKYKKCCYPKYG